MTLVVDIYGITSQFPRDERFGLTAQMRRAAVSIPANIAEGKGRATRGAYANHLSIARGSLKELETLSEIAKRLGFLEVESSAGLFETCDRISRMLTALKRSISR